MELQLIELVVEHSMEEEKRKSLYFLKEMFGIS